MDNKPGHVSRRRSRAAAKGPGQLAPGTDASDERLLDEAINETSPASNRPPTREELIRVAAYHRFVSRGEKHGGDIDDWIAAEAEIDAESARSNSKKSV